MGYRRNATKILKDKFSFFTKQLFDVGPNQEKYIKSGSWKCVMFSLDSEQVFKSVGKRPSDSSSCISVKIRDISKNKKDAESGKMMRYLNRQKMMH